MSDSKKWGHDELQEDLASYIRAKSDKLVWTNMPMGSVGNCRPDVFEVPKSFANFRPIIYEIKVSVSDFRSDVTSGKWQKYLNYACGVVFAVPAGLITKEELPKGCGLIVRHEEVWRMAKAPTLSPLETFPRDVWIKLLIDGIERQQKHQPQPRDVNPYRVREEIRKKYGDKLAKMLSDLDMAEYRLQKAIDETKGMAKQIEETREKALEKAKAESYEINQVKKELCDFFGLPVDSRVWAIRHEVDKLIKRLNANEEINRLQHQLEKIERAIADSKRPVLELVG